MPQPLRKAAARAGHGRAPKVQAKDSREVDIVLTEAEQLREQRDRFLAFAFAASDLLLEVGDDSQIRYAVGATKQLLGGPPASVIGRGWLDIFAAEDRNLLVTKIGELSTRSEEHTSELQSLMRNSYAVLCLKKKKTNN